MKRHLPHTKAQERKAQKRAARVWQKDGYTSELVPRFTRIGPVKVVDRVEAIRQIVTPTKKGDAR